MRQLALELGHRAAFGRDDFLVSDSNRDAVAWIDSWPDWPAPGLVLFGPPASGKTHLANVWRSRSGAVEITASGLDAVVPLAADVRAVVIDNADGGIDETALFHLYNVLAERRGHLLVTGSIAPSRWSVALPDLRSRLLALPAVPIRLPDDVLFEAVLVKLFGDRQLRVEPDLVAYLVTRLDRSFAAAASAVATLDLAGLSSRRALTIPLAREVLRETGLLT